MVETERLRELVADKLHDAGVLASMRAQLRAAVLQVVLAEERGQAGAQPPHIKLLAKTTENSLATQLLLEFLEFHNLEYTAHVFRPEADMPLETLANRSELCQKLSIDAPADKPVLAALIENALSPKSTEQAVSKIRPASTSPAPAAIPNLAASKDTNNSSSRSRRTSDELIVASAQTLNFALDSKAFEKPKSDKDRFSAFAKPGPALAQFHDSLAEILGDKDNAASAAPQSALATVDNVANDKPIVNEQPPKLLAELPKPKTLDPLPALKSATLPPLRGLPQQAPPAVVKPEPAAAAPPPPQQPAAAESEPISTIKTSESLSSIASTEDISENIDVEGAANSEDPAPADAADPLDSEQMLTSDRSISPSAMNEEEYERLEFVESE